MLTDFFGNEIKINDWILTPGYKGQVLILLQVIEVKPKKILCNQSDGHFWGGVMKTEKCVIVSSDIVANYLLIEKLEQ